LLKKNNIAGTECGNQLLREWRCSSVVEHLPSMAQGLGFPSKKINKQKSRQNQPSKSQNILTTYDSHSTTNLFS
jgi:hypothetical protein